MIVITKSKKDSQDLQDVKIETEFQICKNKPLLKFFTLEEKNKDKE